MMNITPRKTHPMIVAAAVAVTVLSLVGSAAILGFIPSAHSERMESTQLISDNNSMQPSDAAGATLAQKADVSQATGTGTSSHYTSASNPVKSGSSSSTQTAACHNCGVVESINLVKHEGSGSGVGAVTGGVAGGLIGNQIGQGKGNVLMTLIGIGGGAYAGNTIEKNMHASSSYKIKVRMEDGTQRTITQSSHPEYAVGDRVKIISGHAVLA